VLEKVLKITVRMQVCEKALNTTTRMEVCENVLYTWQMVGELMEMEGVTHGLLQFLNYFNSLIKKVQVK